MNKQFLKRLVLAAVSRLGHDFEITEIIRIAQQVDERGSADFWMNGNLDVSKRYPTNVGCSLNGQSFAKLQDTHHALFRQTPGNVLDIIVIFQEYTC